MRERRSPGAAGYGVQPLLRGRTAVPHAFELWGCAHAHGPVDGHRCRVLGTGAKMFTIAGPVLVYGTLAAVVYGAVLWVLDTLGMPVLL